MMKRYILILTAAASLAACDKPAEAPATPEAPVEAPAEAPTEEPTAPAESAAGDGHDHDHGKAAAAMPDDMKPGEQGFFGSKFTIIEAPITLAKAIEQAPSHQKAVKVEATVAAVCKKKGCWFTMSGEGVDKEVRVRMKDYSFFVPKNSEKAVVVAEGTLTQREIPQDEAQHYADDAAAAGAEPVKVDGPQKTWEFTATAIELKAAES
jgi:hypothetical protein